MCDKYGICHVHMLIYAIACNNLNLFSIDIFFLLFFIHLICLLILFVVASVTVLSRVNGQDFGYEGIKGN